MPVCTYCNRTKGKRACPASGTLICSRCCGEHRLVHIECPSDCKYLESNEGYQRERSIQSFVTQRAEAFRSHKNNKAVMAIIGLEAAMYRYFVANPHARDWEVILGVEEIKKRLSPLALSGSDVAVSAALLWKDFEPFLKDLDRSEAAELLDAYIPFAKAFSGEELYSRRLQRGLLGFIEHYHPDVVETMQQHQASSPIITA